MDTSSRKEMEENKVSYMIGIYASTIMISIIILICKMINIVVHQYR